MKKIEIYGGASIVPTIAEVIGRANTEGALEFDFNGVTVQVEGDSNPELIYRDWERGMLRSGGFTVTPYPPVELSDEDKAEDARLRHEQEERQRVRQEQYRQEQLEASAVLENALKDAAPMAIIDEEGWRRTVDNNKDGYGAAIVRFAENWARLMQVKIENGARLADVADECCAVADGAEGITGFMYGAAVSILSHVWKHGDELRRWHNLKTQIGNEGELANETGGTLNPALLSIATNNS